MAKKSELAKRPGTALMSMKELEKLYAEDAAAAAELAPAGEGAPRISSNDQTFRVGDTILPDPLEVIVVAESALNVYYDREYDPAEKVPPACFAVAPIERGAVDAMAAHPTSPNMQGGPNGHDCKTCEKNAFGSAERGKGKACANTRQLAVVMADDPGFKSGAELRWATLSLSPTALSPWGKYVTGLNGIVHRPPHGVVTSFSFNKQDKDERRRKAVVAIGYKPITDVNVATRINALRKQLLETKALLRPLPVDGYAAPGTKSVATTKATGKVAANKKAGKR